MNMRQELDYVIVGAGSAGCVIAARLSQDPTVRVALLEAGGRDDAPEIDMPVAFPQLFKTKYDWDFATEPEPRLRERRIYLPRGRTLGGSSTMNAMIYTCHDLLVSSRQGRKNGSSPGSYLDASIGGGSPNSFMKSRTWSAQSDGWAMVRWPKDSGVPFCTT